MLNLKHRNGKSNTRNWFILATAVLITVALMPYGLVAEWFPAFGYLVDTIFSSNLAHFVGHMFIFMVMGTAVLFVFPKLQQKPHYYFLLMSILAFMQEFLQLVTFKHRPVNGGDIFDFVTDMTAATIVYCVIKLYFTEDKAEKDSTA